MKINSHGDAEVEAKTGKFAFGVLLPITSPSDISNANLVELSIPEQRVCPFQRTTWPVAPSKHDSIVV
jgi:hypothetical protein